MLKNSLGNSPLTTDLIEHSGTFNMSETGEQ
jgi:hypothetical protein